jgi:hypothetical protein
MLPQWGITRSARNGRWLSYQDWAQFYKSETLGIHMVMDWRIADLKAHRIRRRNTNNIIHTDKPSAASVAEGLLGKINVSERRHDE